MISLSSFPAYPAETLKVPVPPVGFPALGGFPLPAPLPTPAVIADPPRRPYQFESYRFFLSLDPDSSYNPEDLLAAGFAELQVLRSGTDYRNLSQALRAFVDAHRNTLDARNAAARNLAQYLAVPLAKLLLEYLDEMNDGTQQGLAFKPFSWSMEVLQQHQTYWDALGLTLCCDGIDFICSCFTQALQNQSCFRHRFETIQGLPLVLLTGILKRIIYEEHLRVVDEDNFIWSRIPPSSPSLSRVDSMEPSRAISGYPITSCVDVSTLQKDPRVTDVIASSLSTWSRADALDMGPPLLPPDRFAKTMVEAAESSRQTLGGIILESAPGLDGSIFQQTISDDVTANSFMVWSCVSTRFPW
ncbi:hypothetical protein NliqN6_4452 [Naganishia liquefaciens]|uniref:Uncharacterized protein n=1 Tax=Naganishia liquefaciens TaxID=104408 RepID=A0A8H3TWG9_9TREE|nr:hypothetical protein NliqN6_4452 [Naganishia liquefaciens]